MAWGIPPGHQGAQEAFPEGMGSEDERLSSDGERGGDERFDDYFGGIGAEDALGDGEFGGGPWSGEGPYAYGGGGY